ncbi:molluscan insulin-related peptide 1-like isoform X2 [Actinia tenebrosa]|uniref:Molluscan insulin-related peptide 1-like isoform X2 n=1 Tax=Actinia tenebrosa TaxID=6105 RepID=A0A6P8J6M1_ACTTE|nr:molluscan insulin-related peptide 1-like isoform X2 [Actinia tenebrosa]
MLFAREGENKMFIYTTIMLLLLAEINHSQGCRGYCKINESPQTNIDYRICGDQIAQKYMELCGNPRAGRRNHITHGLDHRSILESNSLAKRFLISRRQPNSQSTDIVEECCVEGCRAEEVQEYC